MLDYQQLTQCIGLQVSGCYEKQTDSKVAAPVVYRDGVAPDRFDGFVENVWVSKAGHVVMSVRTRNRIQPGDRKAITDTELEARKADPRKFGGLPGEYQFRTYRLDGITSLSVCRGAMWVELIASQAATVQMPKQTVEISEQEAEA